MVMTPPPGMSTLAGGSQMVNTNFCGGSPSHTVDIQSSGGDTSHTVDTQSSGGDTSHTVDIQSSGGDTSHTVDIQSSGGDTSHTIDTYTVRLRWWHHRLPLLRLPSTQLYSMLLRLSSKYSLSSTLWASLSGTFLQTLPYLVTPLKRHSLSPRNCPPTRSAPFERFGY